MPWRIRQVLGALLLLACLPSLLLNVGTGRGVLFHDHEGTTLHTHVVSTAVEHGHRHWHTDVHADRGNAADADGSVTPLEQHHDGPVIRGAEATASRKDDSSQRIVSLKVLSVASVLLTAQTSAFPLPTVASHGLAGGTRHTELACLRAVVLLI